MVEVLSISNFALTDIQFLTNRVKAVKFNSVSTNWMYIYADYAGLRINPKFRFTGAKNLHDSATRLGWCPFAIGLFPPL